MTQSDELPKRSAGILSRRRERLEWESDQPFRILSLDGGGIRGIFTATVLTQLEEKYLFGGSVAEYFDLMVGTSTGGIIALGLAAGMTSSHLAELYMTRGGEIFPPRGRQIRGLVQLFSTGYRRKPLDIILSDVLGDLQLRDSRSRLCIPSLDGKYGDVYVFKTPHHPDYKKDGAELMSKVAAATSAAPTYFKPVEDGYIFADGGVWANNPIMVGLVEALSAFNTTPEDIRILSIGSGEEPYRISRLQRWFGGKLAWANIIFASMHFQSMNALGQAGLLIGRDKITRLDPPSGGDISLDDWKRASAILPGEAKEMAARYGDQVASLFLTTKAPKISRDWMLGVARTNGRLSQLWSTSVSVSARCFDWDSKSICEARDNCRLK